MMNNLANTMTYDGAIERHAPQYGIITMVYNGIKQDAIIELWPDMPETFHVKRFDLTPFEGFDIPCKSK